MNERELKRRSKPDAESSVADILEVYLESERETWPPKTGPDNLGSGSKLAPVSRVGKIYPKVIQALNNPRRRWVLGCLLADEDGKLAFTEIKKEIGNVGNASLAHHLDLLQRACLVERSFDLESARTSKDPYYSFYALSEFGREVMVSFAQSVAQGVQTCL